MSYSVRLQREPGFAHFRVTGENSLDTVREYLREISAICARDGLRRVLIEEALEGPRLYSAEVVAIVRAINPAAPRTFERLAYVDVNAPPPPLNMQFAGKMASELGLNIRVFASVDDAKQWLLGEPAEPTETA